MKISGLLSALALALALALISTLLPASAAAQSQPIVIQAGAILDGKGQVLKNARIVVEGTKIARIDPKAQGAAAYDLRGFTVLPGWIDCHVHITYHFGPNGRAQDDNETPAQAALAGASNAWATLMAGFTTVQSVGSMADRELRDAVNAGKIPGPRILTSLDPLSGRGESTGTPDQIREYIRKVAGQGADLVKIFASKSIREGGGPTLSPEQLEAACSEAKKLGLRTLVHAYGPAVRTAALAGCTQVEHGTFATDDDLRVMARQGMFLDPQVRLVIQNYLDNKPKYLGIGNYTEEGFTAMEKALPLAADAFKRALATPNLKVLFGTDAVAGAHGHNAEELIYRVRDGGEDPMHAMIAATSLSAESLGLEKKIGAIAPGMEADIIALDGNPLEDITAVRRVVFVMKGGVVYKHVSPSRAPRSAK